MEHKKMSKEEFAGYVKSHILEYLPQSYSGSNIVLSSTLKNNGTLKNAIIVAKPGEKVSPCIYLDPYYNMLSDVATEDIMNFIAKSRVENEVNCRNIEEKSPELFDHRLLEWDTVKDRILPRVVNTERNQEYLSEHPSREKVDLSMHYRLLVSTDNGGTSTIGVTYDLMEHWGVTEEELFHAAQVNEHNIFPAMVKPIGDMIKGFGAELRTSATTRSRRRIWKMITQRTTGEEAGSMMDSAKAKSNQKNMLETYLRKSRIQREQQKQNIELAYVPGNTDSK